MKKISDRKRELYFGIFLRQQDNGDLFSSQEEKKQEQKS